MAQTHVVITASGPVGSGKSLLLNTIAKTLTRKGCKCEMKNGIYFTESMVVTINNDSAIVAETFKKTK